MQPAIAPQVALEQLILKLLLPLVSGVLCCFQLFVEVLHVVSANCDMVGGFLQNSTGVPVFADHLCFLQGHWLIVGGTCYAPEDELLCDFNFATSSWSRAELTGRSLLRLANYQAACHQGSLLVMRGVQWEDEHDHGTVAHTVHTISPHYTAPADDISSKRYELGSGLRDLFQERQFTDLTLEVDGRRWEVHRVVLGSCSLFLEQLLQGRPASGTQFSES